MNVIEEAAAVCSSAERSLRELMQTAITACEYRHLPALARMAEQISQLADRASQAVEQPPPLTQTDSGRPRRRRRRHRAKSGARNAARGQSKHVAPGVRSAKAGYPAFRHEGDNLLKVGWSKTSRAEYEHRASKRVVDCVVKAIALASQKNQVFTVEALLPITDSADGTEIPAYQVYLVLAWLRTEGLVHQHGRDGYSLLVADNFEKAVQERWQILRDKNGSRKEGQP